MFGLWDDDIYKNFVSQESAHFSIAEALIAAVEKMKWNQTIVPRGELDHAECDSDEEIQALKQRIRIRRTERLKEVRDFPKLSLS